MIMKIISGSLRSSFRRGGNRLFEMPRHVVTEKANRAAGETGQVGFGDETKAAHDCSRD